MNALRISALAAIVTTAALVSGCRTQPPPYAQRELTPAEKNWKQTVNTWYPKWQEPTRPDAPRGLPPVKRMSTRPTQHEQRVTQPTVATRPAPRPYTEPPAVRRVPPPPQPASPAVTQPVFDFPGGVNSSPAGSQGFSILPPGATPSALRNSGNGRPEWYSIQKGDTLSSIAKRFYGSSSHWRRIYDANRSTIASPERLSLGARIRLP